MDEPSAPHKTALLPCPACRAPYPLGYSDRTQCVQCGHAIALTPELIAARDKQRSRSHERRLHDPVWQLAMSSRARFWQQPVFLAAVSYLAPFAALPPAYVLAYRHDHYGQAALMWLCSIGMVHFVTSALLLQRKPELLRQLLSARPPQPPATAPLCRVCSAPLSLPQSPAVIDCSCDHCDADNMLGVTPHTTPRPDLMETAAAHLEVFGDRVSQRAARLYPFALLMGFVLLGVLSYFAIHAPQLGDPWASSSEPEKTATPTLSFNV